MNDFFLTCLGSSIGAFGAILLQNKFKINGEHRKYRNEEIDHLHKKIEEINEKSTEYWSTKFDSNSSDDREILESIITATFNGCYVTLQELKFKNIREQDKIKSKLTTYRRLIESGDHGTTDKDKDLQKVRDILSMGEELVSIVRASKQH